MKYNPNRLTFERDELDVIKAFIRDPRQALSLQWKASIAQSVKTERHEEIERTEIIDLYKEISNLRKEMTDNNRLLAISNDLLLQLINDLKTQESQAYFWSAHWMEAEHSADEDIRNNNVHTFTSAEEIKDFLNSPE